MKRSAFVIVIAVCSLISCLFFVGFKSNPSRVEQLQKKVAELQNVIDGMNKSAQPADCAVKTFESDKDLANFIKQNHNDKDFNYSTVAIDGPTLQNILTDLGSAKYKDTVFVSIVLNSNGRELMLSNLNNRICNTGFCCPPKCRYEPFGLVEMPPFLPQVNKAKTMNPVAAPAAAYKEMQPKN